MPLPGWLRLKDIQFLDNNLLNIKWKSKMADEKPTNQKPPQKTSEKPPRIPTGNPGTRDDGPRPQTGSIPAKRK